MNLKDFLIFKEDNILKIKITPWAKENIFMWVLSDWTLKLKIKSPAIKQKANNELINFLSEELCINKKQIQILHWKTQSRKIILIKK